MGKGRAPCCDKSKVKRGPWSPQEDLQLIAFVQKHGHENWRALPKQAGLQRCGKSCRLRWINYLRPDVKRGNFTTEEEETIIRLHKAMGNKWSKIASCLPGRTDNEIKNVWNTHLKKILDVVKTSESSADESKIESSITSSSSSSSESILSNEIPNLVAKTTTPSSELNEENFQVTMIDETMKESEKELTNEVIGIIEEPNGSSKTSLTSNESNVLNSNHIVGYKTEQQLGSPLPYLGPYDIENVLEEVDQPNQLLEIPWEDYDLWKLLDNTDEPFQSNEVQLGELPMPENPNHNFVQEGVQNVDSMEWSFDFENEFGANEIKESNKDETLPKNYEVEPQRNPFDGFDSNDMTRPTSEFDLDYIQLWPSWPQNPSF